MVVIAFRMADRRAGVALGGAEIKEIRSGTSNQLASFRHVEHTWERQGEISWWIRCCLGSMGEKQVLDVGLLVSLKDSCDME